VLVLYSAERLVPGMLIIDNAVRAAFAVSTGNRAGFYRDFLDLGRFPGEGQKRQNDDSNPGNDQREVDYKVNDLAVTHTGRTITRRAGSPLLYVRAKKRNGKLPLVNKISLIRDGTDCWPNPKPMTCLTSIELISVKA
jgi:hypothetical protein